MGFSIYVRSLGGNYILLPIFEKLESPPTKRFGPRDQMRCGRGEPGASLQIFTASEEIVDIFDFAQLHPKNTFPRGNERKSAKYEKVASESNFPHGEREKMPGPKCSLGVNVFKMEWKWKGKDTVGVILRGNLKGWCRYGVQGGAGLGLRGPTSPE